MENKTRNIKRVNEMLKKKENIVIVEDDVKFLRYVNKLMLKNFSDSNIICFDMVDDKFYNHITNSDTDLFIMDVNLGETNAKILSEKILKEKHSDPLFLFTSGYKYNINDFSNLSGKCIYDFIPKPFASDLFIKTVTSLLNISSTYRLYKNSNGTTCVDNEIVIEDTSCSIREKYKKMIEEDRNMIRKLQERYKFEKSIFDTKNNK